MRTKWVSTEPKQLEYYDAILIHADSGLHEQVTDRLSRYLPKGAAVLDMGAGSGALSKRLADLGYQVLALDVEQERFQPQGIEFRHLDLELGVAESLAGRRFDAICSLEVIEHLRNPWQMMRDCEKALEPGSLLILTTPNITSFYSRLRFLFTGRFHQFEDKDLSYGHINPLTFAEVELIARESGFEVLERRPGGYLPLIDLSGRFWRSLPGNLIRLLVYPFMRGPKEGWCLIYVLRKR